MTNDVARFDDESYRALVDAAPDAMLVVDAHGRIDLVNTQLERLFGYERSELVGQPLDILIPEAARAAHGAHVASFCADGEVRPMGSGRMLHGRHRSGAEIPIEVSLSPLRTKEGPRAAAAIRDAAQSRQLAVARTLFLSSLSHELRTPLNAILGFAQLLVRDRREPLTDRQRERTDQILRGGEHLLRLVNDVLDLSRIEAGQVSMSIEPVAVLDAIREAVATLGPDAARGSVHLALEAGPGAVPAVAADRTRFVQILMNYGANAIKYNRHGGRVSFEVGLSRPGRVRVTVRDTGLGIPIERQDRIFQPFERAGQETGPIEGTGIGLAITKRLAELMRGTVGFTSVPGEGSSFWVDMPVHARPALEGDAPHAEPVGAADLAALRGTVLYVEDNPANVHFMTDFLADYPAIELVVAPTAEMGLELAQSRLPDVILMDIHLPGMSGVEALRTLRSRTTTAHIPVVAVSAAASERDRRRGSGFAHYLTKPLRVEELERLLETLLHR